MEEGKKEDRPLELKSVSPNPVIKEKVVVAGPKPTEITIDEAYFQYFSDRIDDGKRVKPH